MQNPNAIILCIQGKSILILSAGSMSAKFVYRLVNSDYI